MAQTPWKRRTESKRRSGFTLLMALVLLTLAALLLAGLARYSLSMAVESGEACRQLQRRWGETSLCRAVLRRADRILAQRERLAVEQGQRIEECFPIHESVRLGTVEFHLQLDDENRKLNVNRLYAIGGQSEVSQALHQLGQRAATVRLRPQRPETSRSTIRTFESFGQIYALQRLRPEEHSARWLAANAQAVTCWGNGRVH